MNRFIEIAFDILIAGGLVICITSLVVLFGFLVVTLFARDPKAIHIPREDPAPDPYRSRAALNPFEEASAHGSGGLATAAPLHSSLNGSASRGAPPKFEE